MNVSLDRVMIYLGVLCKLESPGYLQGIREAEAHLDAGRFCYKVHGLKYVCYASRLEKALWDGYGVELIFEDSINGETDRRRVDGYNKRMEQAMHTAFGVDVFAKACEAAELSLTTQKVSA